MGQALGVPGAKKGLLSAKFSKPAMRFPMSMMRQILFGAESLGADLQALLKEAQLSESALADSERKLSWQEGIKVWELVMAKTADKDFGLHIGQHVTTSMAGLVGHMMERSKNLLDAALILEKYLPLANEMFEVRCKMENKQLVVNIQPIALWKIQSPETARQAVMLSFSSILHIIRLLTGKPIKPERVELSAGPPENLEAYKAIFNTELRFSRQEDRLLFKESDVLTPIIGYHQEILDVLEEIAEGKLVEQQSGLEVGHSVEKWISRNWQNGFPQIGEAAEALHMSVRTLQRRLKEEGTSFQQIVEECHRQMGISLLKNTSLGVNEISLMLGYADARAFRRAFKRWTGKNPLEMRKA